MTRYSFLFVLLFSLIGLNSYSQATCHAYVPSKIGTKWELTKYTTKGKFNGRVIYELLDKSSAGYSTSYEVKAISYDKKGRFLFNTTFDAICDSNKFFIEMKGVVDMSVIGAYKDMDITMSSSDIEIPAPDTPEGTKLKNTEMSVKMSAGVTIKMWFKIQNRTVDTLESVTTPAGTYSCLKMSQDVVTSGVVTSNVKTKEWYAEGIGLVRSESYGKNGKLIGYTELTAIVN